MSTPKDTDPYAAALTAVAEALEGLCNRRLDSVKALDMATTGRDYNDYRRTLATGEFAGVNDACSLVFGMLRQYRRVSA